MGAKIQQVAEDTSAFLELRSVAQSEALGKALEYLVCIKKHCTNVIFRMPLQNVGTGLAIELEKYRDQYTSGHADATMSFVQRFVEECGYPIMPRNQRLRSEMHALLGRHVSVS